MKADDIFEHSDGVQAWYGKVDAEHNHIIQNAGATN